MAKDPEEFEIQGTISGRSVSPYAETIFRRAIENALKDLIETKNLYQKIDLDIKRLPVLLEENSIKVEPGELSKLETEASTRPWIVSTHHKGDDHTTAEIIGFSRLGTDALGTPVERMSLHFLAPGVQLPCKECKCRTTFEALSCSKQDGGFGSPYPRLKEGGTEQILVLLYRCVSCRSIIHTILVYRKGLRIHLCGISPRRHMLANISLGRRLQPIAEDAANSALEGDIFAGFYHLRTLIEHYLKDRLQIDLGDQITGDELISRYNSSLPLPLKEAVPSLGPPYTELSGYLHSRKGDTSDFYRLNKTIRDHIELVGTLERYHI